MRPRAAARPHRPGLSTRPDNVSYIVEEQLAMEKPDQPVVAGEEEGKTVVATEPAPAAKSAPPKGAPPKPAPRAPGARVVGGKTTEGAVEAPPSSPLRRRIVWTSIVGFLAASFLMFLRFFLPRTIFEPSNTFRIGFPQDYAFGVDTKFQQQYRIWVVRNAERLFVIYARCTHLGCTPDWKPSEAKFKCPCHGSGYDGEGINFEGPAPRPMDRAQVELDPEGQIIVNLDRLYTQVKGAPTQFDDRGAFLRV
jgi:cytochrome b6-f complex iron-sulfur subunit